MWEIRRNRLIEGLKLLDLVQEKVGLASSEFFWIHGKGDTVTFSVASYIMGEIKLVGEGEWPTDKPLYIDRRVFIPFVYASREIKNKSPFIFKLKKEQGKNRNYTLYVRHGNRKAEFYSQKDVHGYGDLRKIMKSKESSVPISDVLQELLQCGKNCAVTDAIVPQLNCVMVSKGKIAIQAAASSDKVFYLGVGNIKNSKIKANIPFPLFLIQLLNENGLKKVSWRGNFIVLEFDKGVIWQPVSQEALSNFPLKKIQKHAKRADKLPISFTVSSRRFTKLMLRLGFYLQALRRKDWVVTIAGKKKDQVVRLSTHISGVKFDERLPLSEPLKKNVKLNWPLDIIEPVFGFLSTKTKKLGMIVRTDDEHGVSYVRTGNYWLAITSKQE